MEVVLHPLLHHRGLVVLLPLLGLELLLQCLLSTSGLLIPTVLTNEYATNIPNRAPFNDSSTLNTSPATRNCLTGQPRLRARQRKSPVAASQWGTAATRTKTRRRRATLRAVAAAARPRKAVT